MMSFRSFRNVAILALLLMGGVALAQQLDRSQRITLETGSLGTVKLTFIDVTASQTDKAVVAATTGKKIRVLSVVIASGSTASTVVFNSKPSGAGTQISGTFAPANNAVAVLGRNIDGWFETNSGEGLSVTTSAGSTTGITITYVLK